MKIEAPVTTFIKPLTSIPVRVISDNIGDLITISVPKQALQQYVFDGVYNWATGEQLATCVLPVKKDSKIFSFGIQALALAESMGISFTCGDDVKTVGLIIGYGYGDIEVSKVVLGELVVNDWFDFEIEVKNNSDETLSILSILPKDSVELQIKPIEATEIEPGVTAKVRATAKPMMVYDRNSMYVVIRYKISGSEFDCFVGVDSEVVHRGNRESGLFIEVKSILVGGVSVCNAFEVVSEQVSMTDIGEGVDGKEVVAKIVLSNNGTTDISIGNIEIVENDVCHKVDYGFKPFILEPGDVSTIKAGFRIAKEYDDRMCSASLRFKADSQQYIININWGKN